MRAVQCWWAILALPYGVLRIIYLELTPIVLEPFYTTSPRQSAFEATRRTFHMVETIPQVILLALYLSKLSSADGWIVSCIVV